MSVPSTDLINLTISDPDPGTAAKIANTYASQLVSYINQLSLASVSQALAQISARLTTLPAGSPARAQLLQEQNTLTALQALSSGGPVVDAEGNVLTTVFAGTTGGGPHGGYGVANSTVTQMLAGPEHLIGVTPCDG